MKKSIVFAMAGALLAVSGMAQAERSGEEVYNTKCHICHKAGVAGAPKLGDKAAWEGRVEKGMETLVSHVKNGFQGDSGMMPPMGTCMDCSDAELEAAVEYMIAPVK